VRDDHDDGDVPRRKVEFRGVSHIAPKAARWLWDKRIPLGEMSLLAGRERQGKSTIAYTLVADVTRGGLPGYYEGKPRSVAVAATEDSWEYTIIPRLMAAGADLDRVLRVEVTAADGFEAVLSLSRDIEGTEAALAESNVVLLLDPLMSRLAAGLDTHKDSEVRQALEPLVAIAQRTGTAVVCLIHLSKATTKDPLTAVMASRAFAAVARAVLFLMPDPDDPRVRLLGLAKSNLGPMDIPVLTFEIESITVAETDDGPVLTGKVRWGDAREEGVADATYRAMARIVQPESGGRTDLAVALHNARDRRRGRR
jgi:hypothetical protein